MRIAYVSADHGIPVFGEKGGAVHIQELVRAMVGLGHRVHLLAARLGGAQSGFPATVEKVSPMPTEPSSAMAGDEDRALKEHRYRAIAAAIESRLVTLHREAGLDFVYERYSLWSAAAVRAGAALGVPTVLEVNAPLVEEQRAYRRLADEAGARAIEAEVLGGASLVVTVSDEVAAYVRSRGAEASRVVVLPNGVDVERFAGIAARGLPADEGQPLTIGFVGSLKPWHGLEVLLGSFRRLIAEGVDARLLIVGDGPLRQYVEGFAHGAELADRIEVTGWVAHGALPATLGRVDVAVAPYPADGGFYFSPLKVFEYLAAGRAIVASDLGQIPRVLRGGECGQLVAPGDEAALAAALHALADDPARRRRLGELARRRALDFPWSRNARAVIDAVASRRAA
ncbi:MAG: glycosyltransferase family 4 protein [Chromatiales bacterium]|nr:glycosyltransferase family 4 protein [Chromatiales bacterium]